MGQFKYVVGIIFCSLFISGCNYFRNDADWVNSATYDLNQVHEDMRPLKLTEPYVPTAAISNYFEYYNLSTTAEVQHFFGTETSVNETLAIHLFVPETPRGTLFLMHGYFDHVGTYANLIQAGLSNQYAIVAWDLAGHGLSSGGRADIGEFDLSGQQLSDIIKRAEPFMPKPFSLIAHSTGCSVSMEYLYSEPDTEIEKVVFLAPLVRHTHWGSSKFGYYLARWFTPSVRRRAMVNSSNKEYLDFVKQDPLHCAKVSFDFLGDLFDWEKRFRAYPVWNGSLFLIQGDQDETVEWKYNVPFLQQKVANVGVKMVKGANHQLCNEPEPLRSEVFEAIFEYLLLEEEGVKRDE